MPYVRDDRAEVSLPATAKDVVYDYTAQKWYYWDGAAWVEVPGGAGGGAPTTADYLVGTANGSLSAEIVVGTAPGGELGGTWATPTVDATHSGSTHAATQAAAEATAAAALSAHASDTTAIHGITDTANLVVGPASAVDNDIALFDGITGKLIKDSGVLLSAKQAADATLTALAAFNTNGLLTQTAADTFAGRTITGTANRLTATNGDGVAGNPTLTVPDSAQLNIAKIVNLTTNGLVKVSAGDGTLSSAANVSVINVVIDGGGSAITTGVKLDLEIPFAATITGATLLADQSGSIVIDIWKDTYANYPPTVADTITAAAKPTISSAVKSQDNTLTGWTTAVTAGDTLRFNVDSITTITRVTLALRITKS